MRAHGLCARAHRQLPHVCRRRRAAPRAQVSSRLHGPPRDELHGRRRPHDSRIAEGRRAVARIYRPLRPGVSGRRRGARFGGRRREPSRHRSREYRGHGADDSRARGARAHLSQRRIDLLQDLDVSRVRQAGAARSRRHQERRPCRQRQVRQGERARLRCLEGDQARGADLGSGDWSRPSRLAHRVLGDGAAPPRGCADRHSRWRRRSHLSASRERDRTERRGHGQAVLALLGARRAPDDRGAERQERQDVEVARERLQPAGRHRQRLPAFGLALSLSRRPLPQAAALLVGGDGAGRGVAPAADGFSRASGHAAGKAGERRPRSAVDQGPGGLWRPHRGRPQHVRRSQRGVRSRARAEHADRRRRARRV